MRLKTVGGVLVVTAALGATLQATHRLIPREELRSKEQATRCLTT